MNYSISRAGMLWSGGSFQVPNLVLNYIKMASEKQLKILLLVLSKDSISDVEISHSLKISMEQTVEIIEYWLNEGVICADGVDAPILKTVTRVVEIKPTVVETKTDKATLKEIEMPRLTQKDIIARCKEDPNIEGLMSESQVVLGRTISVSEQEALVNMVDYYGLSPEVIIMILDYVKSKKIARTSYIYAIAKDWGESGINTVEKAEQRIDEMLKSDKVWKQICIFGELPQKSPTVSQINCVKRWTIDFGFALDVIEYAFEKAKDNEVKRAVPYVNAILTKWNKQQLRTLNDVRNFEQTSSSAKKDNLTGDATYDMDEIKKNLLNETLNFGG